MLRFSVFGLRLRLQAAILSMAIALLVFASPASAVLLDLNVANGDYNVSGNWIDYNTNIATAVPTIADDAIVRNNGTLNITALDGNASAAVIRIGAGAQSGDPVGPLTPPAPYGGGTLNWTGGDILGGASGPRLNVGERDNINDINYTGIVNHSGGKISLSPNASFLVVGSSGTTPTPTSVYNLSANGIIGVTAGSGNSNNGINVRNGTFNMTGGQIVSDSATLGQRSMTISSTSGTVGSENVATANFSAGIMNVNSGIRMASSSNTKAYMTISGTADIKMIGSDFQLGANGTNAYAQVDMSGGSLRVGDAALADQRRLIIGDSNGTSEGLFNLSDGTVVLNHSLVVSNNGTSKGTLYQTGGTLTVRDIELNRQSPAADLTIEQAAIIIDGPNAIFTQQNTTPLLTGETTIGNNGNGRFEIRQGLANIRMFELGNNTASRATLNVFGGKLWVQDGATRDNTTSGAPVVNLTGGELELAPVAGVVGWQANLEFNGTDFTSKSGALLQTNLGNSTRPGNFGVNTGSIWNLDIANGTLAGADWVDVNNGTAGINGGVLNLNYLGGYTPAIGDEVRIVRNLLAGVTLGSVTISDPQWQAVVAASGTEIHLVYGAIPEPSSMLLFGIGVAMFSAVRRSSRK